MVTTHSRHCPGSGPVVIETVQGGVGTSSINYHFVASSPSVRLRPGVAKTEPTGSPLVVAGKRKPSSSGPCVNIDFWLKLFSRALVPSATPN